MELIQVNKDQQGALLPVCRECTIKYKPVKPEGTFTPIWYFLGEAPGFNEDLEGRPFVGDAGKLLRRMILEAGFDMEYVRISNSTACRPTDERGGNRTPEASESGPCFNTFARTDILKTEPKIIIAVGREAFLAMFPDMNRLTVKEMIQITSMSFEGIPVRAIYHTSYLLRTGGANSIYYEPMVKVLREVVSGSNVPKKEVIQKVRVVCSPDELQNYVPDFEQEDQVSLDFESSINSPYDANFQLGVLGLSNSRLSVVVVFKSPYRSFGITKEFNEVLSRILNRRILVFNASFEIPVCIRFFGIDIAPRIHDLMQTCRALNYSGGLKNICRIHIQAPVWNSKVDKWTSTFQDVSEFLYKKRKSHVLILDHLNSSRSVKSTNNLAKDKLNEALLKLETNPSSEKFKSEVKVLTEIDQALYSINELIEKIPNIDEKNSSFYDEFYAKLLYSKVYSKNFYLDYTDLPEEIVCPYNLDDTSYTYDLNSYLDKKVLEKGCQEAAELYDEHVKLGVELTSAGIVWDDNKAEEILKIYNEKSLSTLKSLILHPFLSSSLNLNDAQKLEILSSTDENKLLKYFNPRSPLKTTKEKFSSALFTNNLKIYLILYLFSTETDLLHRIKEDLELASRYSNLLKYISEDEKTQLSKAAEFFAAIRDNNLSSPTEEEVYFIKKARNYIIEGINQEMFESMFSMFTKFVGVDPNKRETWTEEFLLLYYCRLFKKVSKGRSAYIQGKCGRGQVRVVDRTDSQEKRLPLRLRTYGDNIPLAENEIYILQPEYKPTDALCLTGDTKILLSNGDSESIEYIYSNFEKNKFKTYSVDSGQIVEKFISDVFLSSKVSNLIKINLENGKYITCTENHRFLLKDGSYKEAKDLTENDDLYDFKICFYCSKIISKIYAKKFCSRSCHTTFRNFNDINLRKARRKVLLGNKFMSEECRKKGIETILKPEIRRKAQESRVNNGSFKRTLESAHSKVSRDKATKTVLNKSENFFIDISKRNYKNSSHKGYLRTVKGGIVYYYSSWEKQAYKLLDMNEKVLRFKVEPFCIYYKDKEGKDRKYYPDVLITYTDTSEKLVEIKSKYRLLDEDTQLKIEAGSKYCTENNIRWEVCTGNILEVFS